MSDELEIECWANVIDDMLCLVPEELRASILAKAVEKENADRKKWENGRFQLETIPSKWTPHDGTVWRRTMKIKSTIIQVFCRSITNNHSPAEAAKILFAEHHNGTGSGWLPDYLDGLPAVKVNRKRAAKLSDEGNPEP